MSSRKKDLQRLAEIKSLLDELPAERLTIWRRRRDAGDTTYQQLAEASGIKTRSNILEALKKWPN